MSRYMFCTHLSRLMMPVTTCRVSTAFVKSGVTATEPRGRRGVKTQARSFWSSLREGPGEEPLAPAARDWRWWLSALRRRPWLAVTAAGGLVATMVLKQVFPVESAPWLVHVAVLIGMGLLGPALGIVHVVERSRVESDDVQRERMTRRPPQDGSFEELPRPCWSWRGPRARHTLRCSGALAGFGTAFGVAITADPWGWRQGGADRVAFLVLTGALVVAPLATAVVLPVIVARRARHLLARPLRPEPLRLLGVGARSQNWYAVRGDDPGGERLVLPRFPGRSLLVAGDTVQVWMADEPPQRPGERLGDAVPVALTLQGHTLWATLAHESTLRAGGHLQG
jgi:hypothetical protein